MAIMLRTLTIFIYINIPRSLQIVLYIKLRQKKTCNFCLALSHESLLLTRASVARFDRPLHRRHFLRMQYEHTYTYMAPHIHPYIYKRNKFSIEFKWFYMRRRRPCRRRVCVMYVNVEASFIYLPWLLTLGRGWSLGVEVAKGVIIKKEMGNFTL